MAIGRHRLEYEVVEGWSRLPEGVHPLIVFDKEGRFVTAWGEGRFVRPHGIFITPEDRVFLVDDEGHSVSEG